MKKLYLFLLALSQTFIFAQYNGNKKTDSTKIVVETKEIEGFKIYPNPVAEDRVYISSKNNSVEEVIIYDVFGKIALHKKVRSQVVDISNLMPGVYYLQAKEKFNSSRRKLIVK